MLTPSEHLRARLRDGFSFFAYNVASPLSNRKCQQDLWRLESRRTAMLRNGVTFLKVALVITISLAIANVAGAQVSGPPSADCHVTDGTFTACSNGHTEWSDVQ